MVVLPEPDTPITTSAQGISLTLSLTKILRKGRLVGKPDGLAKGMRAVGGQGLARQHARQDRALVCACDLEQHFARRGKCRQGERDPWHERLDVGLWGAHHPTCVSLYVR